MNLRARDRAIGALAGVAIGDAMGMPTQTLSREAIMTTYGTIADFTDAVTDHPVSGGLKAGTITDDTEQSLLLARHFIERQGRMDQQAWANTLLAWERDTRVRGVNDLLGPSTKRAIEALIQGTPVTETGRYGTTNGAAMRIVPVGIATAPEPLSALVDAVAESCCLTHNTAEAIGSAAAVAAVVSAGIDGAAFEQSLALALAAAAEGEKRGTPSKSGSIVDCIAKALALSDQHRTLDAAAGIADAIGTSVAANQSVPMAFAITRLAKGDPWQAALVSSMIGDDTDTIGAISCGMASACVGLSQIPIDKWQYVRAVNALNVEPIADALLGIRNQARAERCK